MKYACFVRLERRVCIQATRRSVASRRAHPGADQSFLDMPELVIYTTRRRNEE